MLVNVNFMKDVEKNGLKLEVGDIIITTAQKGSDVYMNYICEVDYRIKLLDLKFSIFYGEYDSIEELADKAKKGYLINAEGQPEVIRDIIKRDDVIEALKLQQIVQLYPQNKVKLGLHEK